MEFRWCALIRHISITLEANNFSTICPENIYHITVRLHCHSTTTTGVWEKLLALHIMRFITYGGHFVSHKFMTFTSWTN